MHLAARLSVGATRSWRASETRTASFTRSPCSKRSGVREIGIVQHAVAGSGHLRVAPRVVGSFVVSSPPATVLAENPGAAMIHHKM